MNDETRKRFAIGARIDSVADSNLKKWLRGRNISMPVLLEIMALESKSELMGKILSLPIDKTKSSKVLSIRIHESVKDSLYLIDGFSISKILRTIGNDKKLFDSLVDFVNDFSFTKQERNKLLLISERILKASKNEDALNIVEQVIMSLKLNRLHIAIHLMDYLNNDNPEDNKDVDRLLRAYTKLCSKSKRYGNLYNSLETIGETSFLFGYPYLKTYTVEKWLKEKERVQKKLFEPTK